MAGAGPVGSGPTRQASSALLVELPSKNIKSSLNKSVFDILLLNASPSGPLKWLGAALSADPLEQAAPATPSFAGTNKGLGSLYAETVTVTNTIFPL